ncbi:MAG: SPOR domain-containing protein [Sulfuricellaceae bacterium]|jgi:hypothetical protein
MTTTLRWLFILLLLANGLFFAYGRFALPPSGEPLSFHPSLNSDKLKPLGDLPAPVPALSTAAPATGLCLEWGALGDDKLPAARQALDNLRLPPNSMTLRRLEENTGNYWVYIPPLRSAEDAQKKLGEVRALGVEEGYILQGNASWKNAISLGVFSTEEGAKRQLATLQAKGVRSAVVGARKHDTGQTVIRIRQVDDKTMAEVVRLKLRFPNTTVKAVDCAKP